MVNRKRILVFASGDTKGGGSGFKKLVETSRSGLLGADIVAVVTNYANGGVQKKAVELGTPCHYFPCNSPEVYAMLVEMHKPDLIVLSGWLKKVAGLDPRITINIHPGHLPEFGGPGMYGHHVHEAVLRAYHEGKLLCSSVSMHFVTAEYDKGPIIFQHPVPVYPNDTAETLGARVNAEEHVWQWWVTNLVVKGLISWDGENPQSVRFPPNYPCRPQ